MNNLLYNTRMALRDIMEVNIFTKGSDRVYVTLDSELSWEGNVLGTDTVVVTIVDRLLDMDLVLAGGESGIGALRDSEPVEILRNVA